MTPYRPFPFARRVLCFWPAVIAGLGATSASAGSVELITGRPLDFGKMVVFGSGTKQVTPDGQVSVSGLVSIPGAREGPAEFTLRYRPDGRTKSALVIVPIATVGPLSSNGTVGSLSGLGSDLPGFGSVAQGDAREVRLPVCATTVCDIPFRIGGTLTISGGAIDARFSFPLQVTVRLLTESAG